MILNKLINWFYNFYDSKFDDKEIEYSEEFESLIVDMIQNKQLVRFISKDIFNIIIVEFRGKYYQLFILPNVFSVIEFLDLDLDQCTGKFRNVTPHYRTIKKFKKEVLNYILLKSHYE